MCQGYSRGFTCLLIYNPGPSAVYLVLTYIFQLKADRLRVIVVHAHLRHTYRNLHTVRSRKVMDGAKTVLPLAVL